MHRPWIALTLVVALALALWLALSLRSDAALELRPAREGAESASAPDATSQPAAGETRRPAEAAAGAARGSGSVAGVVRDRSAQPLAGARVRATRVAEAWWLPDPPEVLAQATADARGRFLLNGLPLARLRLLAVAEGFAPALGPSPTLTAERPDRDGIVIRLFPAHSLQGRVLDAQGQPVAGAAVVASLFGSRLPWPDRPTAVTDAEGRFAVTGVPLGFVNVSAWKDGLGMTPRVRVEAETTEVELRMDPAATGSVRIELVDAPAGTVLPLRMYVNSQSLPTPLQRLRVHAEEPLLLAGLLPDQYMIQPEAPPDLVVEAPRSGSGGTGWEITAGATVHYRMRARPAGPALVLRGRVLDPQGRPVAGQELVFSGAGTSGRSTVRTGSDGAFSCDSPTPPGGRVFVRLSDPGWVFATGRGVADLTVQPNEPLDLIAVRAARLSGTVTDAAGQPVSGVDVDLFPLNARYTLTTATTDGHGRYQFESPAPQEDPVLVEVCDPVGYGRREGIRLEPGREADGSFALLPATGIEGNVRTADGQPVPGAQVHIRAPADQIFETWSDRDGRYRLALRPQTCRIEAMARGAMLATTSPIVVRAGAMTTADLVFPAPHWIAGVVRLAGGAPANGFNVAAWPHDRREGQGASSGVTDQTGHFRLQVDAAGEYHLRVTWPWLTPSRWRLQVDGETHTVQADDEQIEIRLQRDMGSVSGRIVVAGDALPVPAEVTMGPIPLATETAAQPGATPARSSDSPIYSHRMPLTAGAFRLEQVEDRDFVLRLRHPHFRTLDVPVSVVAGQETRLGDLVLEPAGLVSGRVCDARGAPLADAEIWCWTGYQFELFEPHKPSGEVVGRTDADGRFTCRALQSKLEMQQPQMLQVRKDGFAPAACHLDPAAPPQELQFRLPAAGIVRVLPPKSWLSNRYVVVTMRLLDPPATDAVALWPGNAAQRHEWMGTEPLVLRGMPVGTAVLLSLQEGQTKLERTVTAQSGEVTTWDLSGQ